MAETNIILESKNLDLFYGDHQALKGISMAILSGSDLPSLYRLMEGESVGTLFPA